MDSLMRNTIILVCTLAGAFWFYHAYDHLHGWKYAIAIFLGGFVGWSISSVLLKASGNLKSSKHTSSTVGIIKELGYSTIRINNMPRFKASVKYLGIEKTFEPLDPNTHLSLSTGDQAIIKYDPNKLENAYFDLEASIKLKSSRY